MIGFIIVSTTGGILFGLMDGLINANPLAKRLYEVFRPIAKTSLNPILGISIDLVYGFVLAGLFLLLYPSLPGEAGLVKGISFSLLAWFFRVVMNVASQWMMYKIPGKTHLYTLATGFAEMLVLGVLYGLSLKPVM